jgi:anti-anti-sigma regulatory factor
MRKWASAFTTVASTDSNLQRRARSLIVLALGMAVLSFAFVPVVLSLNAGPQSVFTTMLGGISSLCAAFLGRAGRVNLGAYLLIGFTLFGIVASIPVERTNPSTPYYLVLVVLLGGALLPPVQIWGAFLACILGLALGIGLLPPEWRANDSWRQTASAVPLMLGVITLIAFVSARTTAAAFAAAQRARQEAEDATASLAASNASLEARVQERTAALRQVADEQRALATQLGESLEAQQELNQVIAELAVPILPISNSSLVAPLIGSIDSDRARQLLVTILERVEATGARTLLLDVTGVAVIDTQVAASLLQIADAAHLMGAQTILVGIRPEVAQTLVELGVDLGALKTAATLQDGVASLIRGIR